MAYEVVSLSVTDASNNSAAPNGFATNMARSNVTPSARALMGSLARYINDNNGTLTLAGGTTAYTVTINSTTVAGARGETLRVKVNATNTGAVTIAVTPFGGAARVAVAIQKGGKALVAGELVANDIVELEHDGTQYQMVGLPFQVTAAAASILDDATVSAMLDTLGGTPATGSGGVVRATSPSVTGLNVTDGALQVKSQQIQSFTTLVANVAGTLKHQIYTDNTNQIVGNFCGKISGASATQATTPTVSSGTGFTSGGGITGTNFVYNTAAQTAVDSLFAGPTLESTVSLLTNPTVQAILNSRNVNGVTQVRLEVAFTLAATGGAWTINTTNIPSGDQIGWRQLIFLA